MIAVTVQRSPGDKPGPDIIDPLLTADQAAVERGRNEIDGACSSRSIFTCTGPHRRFVLPGTIVEYQGSRETWRGMVRRCAITITRDGNTFYATRALEIERAL
jgi:hypothetical protein